MYLLKICLPTSGEKISISAKTPFILQQTIVESRINNIPVEYVLYNKQQDQFEKVKHYNNRMFFDLPEDDIDINLINAKYEILLLVNNDIVHMNFPALDPELPPTQERKKFEASEIKQSLLSVLPNPAQNEISISLENGNITQFKLYNSLGELEIEKKVDIDHLSIDISIFSSGVYFIDVLTSDNKHIQQKLIIQK